MELYGEIHGEKQGEKCTGEGLSLDHKQLFHSRLTVHPSSIFFPFIFHPWAGTSGIIQAD
jgi:hypothetical protein